MNARPIGYPPNAIAAASHPDPYPYYADLVARRPFDFDADLGLWVAASAAAVEATLTNDACRVRPPAEPVPRHLLGTPMAAIFRHLVRMNDGADHCPFKGAIVATIDGLSPEIVAARAAALARDYLSVGVAPLTPALLDDYCRWLPSATVASLLGVAAGDLGRVVAWVGDLVRGLAAATDPGAVATGAAAAAALLDHVGALLDDTGAHGADTLLGILAREAARAGRDDRATIVANAIGFLTQTYEATAGLLGNLIVALGRDRALLDRARADADTLAAIVATVLRDDPPIQNTRRFVAADTLVAGRATRAGDAILVLLAAANRDPARSVAGGYSFGFGGHACPGAAVASAIAAAGIGALLDSGADLPRLSAAARYRPLPNARLPRFEA